MKMMISENCPSKKKKCERHGKCDECRKYHEESKWQRPVYCEKEIKGLKKLFGRYKVYVKSVKSVIVSGSLIKYIILLD